MAHSATFPYVRLGPFETDVEDVDMSTVRRVDEWRQQRVRHARVQECKPWCKPSKGVSRGSSTNPIKEVMTEDERSAAGQSICTAIGVTATGLLDDISKLHRDDYVRRAGRVALAGISNCSNWKYRPLHKLARHSRHKG
jgi:hypothetical protein